MRGRGDEAESAENVLYGILYIYRYYASKEIMTSAQSICEIFDWGFTPTSIAIAVTYSIKKEHLDKIALFSE